jgi:hypothetical protein
MRWNPKGYPRTLLALKYELEHVLIKHLAHLVARYGRRRFAVAFGINEFMLQRNRTLDKHSSGMSVLFFFYLWMCTGGTIEIRDRKGRIIFQSKGEKLSGKERISMQSNSASSI